MTKEPVDMTIATEKIEAALRVEKERVSQEIREYPSPIPACDAQFNYLLEKRDLLSIEMARLHTISVGRESAVEKVVALRKFLTTSQCLNRSAKIELSASLDA